MHKQQGWPQAWEYCQVKLIQTLGRASQRVEWSSALVHFICYCFVSASRSTTLIFRNDIFRKRSTKPLLKQKRRQKHLTWAKEKKNWTVAQWYKVLFSDKSKCCISFGPLCFLKSTVNAAIYQDILEHFMLPSAHKFYGDADFIFQQDFTLAHTAKGTKSWFNNPWCYCAWLASKLAWPEPHRESMRYCQEEDKRHQTQQCRWPEGHYQSNLGFHYTWAVPRADCLHAMPHWCSNSCFSEAWHFFLKHPFLLIICNIQIFWDTEFWVFIICKP